MKVSKRKRGIETEEGNMPPKEGGSARTQEIYVEDYEQYVVFVKSDTAIKQITLATRLFKLKGKNITNIIPINMKTCKVICANKVTANELITEQPVESVKFYLPFFIKYSYGILKGIDTDITEEDIIEMLKEQVKIKSVYRFNRKVIMDTKNTDADICTYVPTNTVKLEFEADQVPGFVCFYSLRVKVHPYYPRLKACYKCCRYGHVTGKCRQDIRMCVKCGETKCKADCEIEKMCCFSCRGSHQFGAKECLIREKEELISKLMTDQKLTYNEAKNIYYRPSYEPPTYTEMTKNNEYPQLEQQQQRHHKDKVNNNTNTDSGKENPSSKNKKSYTQSNRQERANDLSLKIEFNKHKIRTNNTQNLITRIGINNRKKFKKDSIEDNNDNFVNLTTFKAQQISKPTNNKNNDVEQVKVMDSDME